MTRFLQRCPRRTPIPQRAHIPGAADADATAAAGLDAVTDAATAAATGRRLQAAGELADGWAGSFADLAGVDFDSPAAVRALLQSGGPPLGTVARANAETACRWLTEGARLGCFRTILSALTSHGPHPQCMFV